MWPMYLDMSRDECKRFLRCLELDAYSSIVSAFRAQGELNAGKRKLLLDLCASLSISTERHKAEVRRAANDEKLATVAEQIEGPNTNVEWAIEGRRLIPLLPRLVPQTAFTALANNVANATAAENAMLPPPSMTFKKRVVDVPVLPTEPSTPEASKTIQQAAGSATPNNVMTLPPGTSIQLKRDVDGEKNKKRQRSVTFDDQPHTPLGPPAKMSMMSHQQPAGKIISSNLGKTNPLKLTPCRTTATTQPSNTQKVIIVSNSSTSGSASNASILQRSLSVPLVKTATCQSHVQHRVNPSVGHTTQASTTTVTASYGTPPTTAYITTSSGVQKSRPMTVQLPTKPRPRSNSIMIPMVPNHLPSTAATTHKATLHTAKPSVRMPVKQDAAANVKMLAIGSTATKILPKPSASSASPAYIVSAPGMQPPTMPMISRTAPSHTTPRVITVSTTTATPTIHSVTAARQPFRAVQKVHLGSGLTPVRPAGSAVGGGKTNVIVVQKGATSGYARGVTLAHGGKEITRKITLSKNPIIPPRSNPGVTTVTVQRPATPGSVPGLAKTQAIQLPANTMSGNVFVLDVSPEQFSKNTVLADILQASGILASDVADMQSADSPKADAECIEIESVDHCVSETSELTAIGSNEIGGETTSAVSNVVKPEITADSQAVTVEEERIVSLEQAVGMFGNSGSAATPELPTQSHVQVADQPAGNILHDLQTEIVDDSIHHVAHEEDVVCGEPDVMEVIGELDPQTGVYSVHAAVGGSYEASEDVGTKLSTVVPMDIFSTALASANINLETFQYMDEGLDNLHAAIINTDSLNENHEFATYSQYESTNEEVADTVTKQTDKQQSELDVSKDDDYSTYLQPNVAHIENTAVTVEPSNMDTTDMYIEDFTSQKV